MSELWSAISGNGPLLLAVFVVVYIAYSLYGYRHQRRMKQDGVQVTAYIESLCDSESSSLIVAYTVDGVPYRAMCAVPTLRGYVPGDPVQVLYDPRNPGRTILKPSGE